jgi:peptidoglycan-associated lipoprotein
MAAHMPGSCTGLFTVHFDFDRSDIRPDQQAALDAFAECMQKDARLQAEIEGHTDARGTTEYNMVLGEKRARVTSRALMDQGVNQTRLNVKSFGKERPLDEGMSEEAHAKNRRSELRATN